MPKGRPRTFTEAEMRRLRAAVEDAGVTLNDTSLRFKIGVKTLRALIEREGWQVGRRQAAQVHGPPPG